jgi:hypothetical protein
LFLFIATAILAFASAKASEQHAKTAERALTELPITGDGYQANMFVGWIIGPETRRNEELQTNPPFRVLPLPLAEPLIFHGLLTYSDIFGKRYYCGFAHRINTDGSTQPISRVEAYVRRD